jgi:hypothetical protein
MEWEDEIFRLLRNVDDWKAERDAAPAEQWERVAVLVATCRPLVVADVFGWHSGDQLISATRGMAAVAGDETEASAWRELSLAPRYLVIDTARALSKKDGTWRASW